MKNGHKTGQIAEKWTGFQKMIMLKLNCNPNKTDIGTKHIRKGVSEKMILRKQMEKNPPRITGKRLKSGRIKDTIELTTMVLPGAFFFLLFCYVPMFGIIIAFKNYVPLKGIFGSEWCGLKNFEFFFTSIDCGRVMRNTILYSLAFLLADIVFGVLMAVLLYNLRSRIGLKVYHTVMILPRFMSTVIIAFIVYALLSPSYGVVNTIITSLGGEAIQWYSEPKYWPTILMITHIWSSVGMNSVLYYSTLVNLDAGLLEAAELDGANWFQKVWHIMVPHLTSVIIILLILGIGKIFSGDFGLFYQVPKDQGVLYPTTDIINTYTFRALMSGSMAKSAAVGLFQSLSGMVMVVVTNLIVRQISPEDSLF